MDFYISVAFRGHSRAFAERQQSVRVPRRRPEHFEMYVLGGRTVSILHSGCWKGVPGAFLGARDVFVEYAGCWQRVQEICRVLAGCPDDVLGVGKVFRGRSGVSRVFRVRSGRQQSVRITPRVLAKYSEGVLSVGKVFKSMSGISRVFRLFFGYQQSIQKHLGYWQSLSKAF